MKKLKKLGKALNKATQKTILGGFGGNWYCCGHNRCCYNFHGRIIREPGRCHNGRCILY